jgi:diguanylate cyclase (GGDEF)-like protein
MGGAVFILAINISVAGLLTVAFAAIAIYDRSFISARWFAITYATGLLYALVEFALPFLGGSQLALTVNFALFLAALGFMNVGLGKLYGKSLPWPVLAAIGIVAIAGQVMTSDLGRESLTRLFAFQAPYFIMQALGAAIVMRAGRRGRSALVLAGALLLSALYFLFKPYLALWAGGPGVNSQSYIASNYAMFSQATGTVLALSIALIILFVLTRRLLAQATLRARTDSLSGLLNRGGFEDMLANMLADSAARGLPLSLVLADLDHFKAVNDTYGHGAGDRVIALFANKLKGAADAHFAIGRIGGEEFAVALPGVNLTAARLFAETVRAAFVKRSIAGLPPDVFFTASFGITEVLPGETMTEALARADAALYEAKQAGRDCVRVKAAPRRLIPLPGERRRFRR